MRRRVNTASFARFAAGALAVGVTLPLSGCFTNTQSGLTGSRDKHTYVSTTWRPWTVTLVDTRTGEPLWSVDVPVGQQLVVDFTEGSGPNEYKPDMMAWRLMEAGRLGFGGSKNRIPVPSQYARRIEPTLRPVPEFPGVTPPESPFTQPDETAMTGEAAPPAARTSVEGGTSANGRRLPVGGPVSPLLDNAEEPAPSEPEPASDDPIVDLPDE
ncbi:MAG: hypothetical protein AAGD00_04035 [Planctomycetota bacterium]